MKFEKSLVLLDTHQTLNYSDLKKWIHLCRSSSYGSPTANESLKNLLLSEIERISKQFEIKQKWFEKTLSPYLLESDCCIDFNDFYRLKSVKRALDELLVLVDLHINYQKANLNGFKRIIKKLLLWDVAIDINMIQTVLNDANFMTNDCFFNWHHKAVEKIKAIEKQLLNCSPISDINAIFVSDDLSNFKSLLVNKNFNSFYLFDAAANYNASKCLKYLLESHHWESVDNNGQTILHRLCSLDNLEPFKESVNTVIKANLTSFSTADYLGRTFLHLACKKNHIVLLTSCLHLADKQTWLAKDQQGWDCASYAIASGHSSVFSLLLNENHSLSDENLFLAINLSPESVKLILKHGLSVEKTKVGLLKSLNCFNPESWLLLFANGNGKEFINIKEKVLDQSMLILASRFGYGNIIQELLKNGVNVCEQDRLGLNAYDYSVYNSFPSITNLLDGSIQKETINNLLPKSQRKPVRVKHILKEGSLIELHLGSRDIRLSNPLSSISSLKLPVTATLKIWSPNSQSVDLDVQTNEFHPTSHYLQLPLVSSNHMTSSVYFYTKDADSAVLYLDIVDSHSIDSKQSEPILIARASISLKNQFTSLWREQKSLGGQISKSFMSMTGEVLTDVMCEITVVNAHSNPYFHSTRPLIKSWDNESTVLVGHRGLGMNQQLKFAGGLERLQLGENTVESLGQGGRLGANYVEFDVQLTKDLVPIIYHDFNSYEWGLPLPLNSLNLSDFLNKRPRRQRRQSNSDAKVFPVEALPVKANGNGTIQLPFASLQQAFQTVPRNIGFNIEVKYPCLQEAEAEQLNMVEINLFCDRILDIVATYCHDRELYFSSFQAEVCRMLNHFPVFFLTEGGTAVLYDKRLNSLKSAVSHIREIGCHGIVTHCAPFVKSPQLIRYIRDQGIVSYSYGGMNNEKGSVEAQLKGGLDGIIVDRVVDVRKILNSNK
ncbi:Glycerophosphocholine phosphodiesterase [Globomyces sp. JEL0801]|nr:Glycerophosphocholine phosphodiesterase [Globomyces sp. JEL0801]